MVKALQEMYPDKKIISNENTAHLSKNAICVRNPIRKAEAPYKVL